MTWFGLIFEQGVPTLGEIQVILHSSFFIPQISPKILNCSPVLVPDETKIKGHKGHKGRKGHPGQGRSRFGERETETLVHFQATQHGPGFAGGSRIPN